ncbi:MAG: hypothetical protein K8I29_04990 [Alphaproteobacteria bacterium]|uniref:Uncharacterized protein n=1 Tax=Candidatus Nitrobium versatile TaxID=2884831 RepID=A0A953J931_9BACT|nr:hypothetical protein [Candidatus Nitrobium versatile]
MRNNKSVDRKTIAWWTELDHYKKENGCCTLLKEGAVEEHLKLAFDEIIPVKFGVNYCCQCGSPLKRGFEKRPEGKEDWCCRVMRTLNIEQIEFSGTGRERATTPVTHCFHCGREFKKQSDGGKAQSKEKDDKRD